jgi:hypothetical protein
VCLKVFKTGGGFALLDLQPEQQIFMPVKEM